MNILSPSRFHRKKINREVALVHAPLVAVHDRGAIQGAVVEGDLIQGLARVLDPVLVPIGEDVPDPIRAIVAITRNVTVVAIAIQIKTIITEVGVILNVVVFRIEAVDGTTTIITAVDIIIDRIIIVHTIIIKVNLHIFRNEDADC